MDYAVKALVKPIISGAADIIEVKETAENRTTNTIHLRLRDSVFAGKCSNWYIGDFGRNAASWPGMAIEFWFATLFPDRSAFVWTESRKSWLTRFTRGLQGSRLVLIALTCLAVAHEPTRLGLSSSLSRFVHSLFKFIQA